MRRRAMKPYTRVGLVVAVFIVVAVTTMGVAGWYERDSRSRLDRVNSTITPNLDLIAQIRDRLSSARAIFNVATFSPPDQRGTLVASGTGDNNEVQQLIAKFNATPTVVTNESALRNKLNEAYLVAQRVGTETGIMIANPASTFNDIAFLTALRDANVAFQNTDRAAQAIQSQYLRLQASEVSAVDRGVNNVRDYGFGLGIVGFSMLAMFSFLMYRSARRDHRKYEKEQAERAVAIHRNEFETRLQRALDLADSEDEVYPVVGDALSKATEGIGYSELLLADSSRAHFHRVAASNEDVSPGCPVTSPNDCPATRRGQPIVFTSSNALDACRHLRDRPDGPCSALCEPVQIAGGTLGVVHTVAPEDAPPSPATTELVELTTRKTAERVGMLRAFAQAETQARTDALTGLLNRRSLEAEVARTLVAGSRFVVAFGDLDHFKQVNDIHGHAAGDRALRVAARALRDSVRPTDLVARYGGEEFIIVLPDCDTVTAVEVLERVRERFVRYLEAAAAPRVTMSFGVASGDAVGEFEATVAQADEALLAAKSAGRDRVIISGGEHASIRSVPAPDPGAALAGPLATGPTGRTAG
ncbi:MAG: diguanylate cyclase [Acidimicrobiia bacterium]